MMKLEAFVPMLLFLVFSLPLANAHSAAAQPLAASAPSASPQPADGPAKKWVAVPDLKQLPFQWGKPELFAHANDPKVKKCLAESSGYYSCSNNLVTSFLKHEVSLKPGCCKAIQQLDDRCSSAVFAVFKNQYFPVAVKNQCAKSHSS
ncbi:hypothetical protein Patl1_26613 [Pistacia atlantica]|uniref:Uncharacterized protein n=1 Tax=Pistacia atlantica TaxID=434234 RepID=A0ACC1AZC1_9ROSI|nr:hypothetical protein Patl1_26613 [Pistacia atlantica]